MANLITVISGGQTGVDRAGLDAALEVGIPIGGWCPKGRRAEDGKIPEKYTLIETPESNYLQRTEWNSADADATIIISRLKKDSPGVRYTKQFCKKWQTIVIDFSELFSPMFGLKDILDMTSLCRVINVAGPREESDPGVHDWAFKHLCILFEELKSKELKS
jgi:hypothetical protein